MMRYAAIASMLMIAVASHAAVIDESQPVTIDADSLEVLQQERRAIFEGNVRAIQGEVTLRSQKMIVYYDATESQSVSAMGALSRIEVSGNVSMQTPDESATSARGVFDAQRNRIYLFGNVVLTRGDNILKGAKLEYDVPSGSSMLSGTVSGNTPQSTGSRVRGVFVPQQNEQAR